MSLAERHHTQRSVRFNEMEGSSCVFEIIFPFSFLYVLGRIDDTILLDRNHFVLMTSRSFVVRVKLHFLRRETWSRSPRHIKPHSHYIWTVLCMRVRVMRIFMRLRESISFVDIPQHCGFSLLIDYRCCYEYDSRSVTLSSSQLRH